MKKPIRLGAHNAPLTPGCNYHHFMISFFLIKPIFFHKTNIIKSVWINPCIGFFKRIDGLIAPAKFTCVTKKERLATILYQELVKKKEKYSDRFELKTIVYNEERYPYIWQWNICTCSNFIVFFLLASNKRTIFLRKVFIRRRCLFQSLTEKCGA